MRLIKQLGTNMEITEAIGQYLEERLVKGLEKFAAEDAVIEVEVEKTTNHHKNGDVFRAEAMARSGSHSYRAESTKDDLYAAIDDVRDDLKRQLTEESKKETDMHRREAAKSKEAVRELGAEAMDESQEL